MIRQRACPAYGKLRKSTSGLILISFLYVRTFRVSIKGAVKSELFVLSLIAFITLVVPTTKAELIPTPLVNVEPAPLTLSGALISTSPVPVRNISI